MKKTYRAFFSLALIISFLGIIAPVLAEPNVNAMHRVDVKQLSTMDADYAILTKYSTEQWGLSTNPYPDYLPLATGVKTSYKIFTTQIGDDVYDGVSCNTYTSVNSNFRTITQGGKTGYLLDVTNTYDAVWYLGDYGKDNARMNSGFNGTVIVVVHDYNTITKTYSYWNAVLDLKGFQSFNHQSIHLTIPDSRVTNLGTGYCDVLGNRDKS